MWLENLGGFMNLYVGIDLHSTNSYIGIINDDFKNVMEKRVPNNKDKILNILAQYSDKIIGVVVESTYNWYWLVDALMAAGYKVHLANPAAMKQYEGIKYLNDKHDANWLAKMLKLGILPEGYIFPKNTRAIRDLLRRRGSLVQKRTAFKLMLQQIYSNQKGESLSNNAMEKMKYAEAEKLFEEEAWQMNGLCLYETSQHLKKQITEIEKYVLKQCKDEWSYKGLKTVPGVGVVLGLTIALETGPIERFLTAGDYASYARCVPTAYWSNKKKKGTGNQKNGNKYLAWAYAEAASFCMRHCEEAKMFYQRKTAKTNKPKAYRALANKLSKACYFIMRDGMAFDVNKLFQN